MCKESKASNFILAFLLFAAVLLPVIPNASSSNQAQPTAFLPGWNISYGQGSLHVNDGALQDNYLQDEYTPYDYDEQGNLYIAVTDDYGSFGGYTYSGRGIQIMKFDQNGTLVWGKRISTSNYCNSPNYIYCKAVGLHVIGEDQFYLLVDGYSLGTTTFSVNLSLSINYYQLITAFHDSNNGWSWADALSTTSYGTITHHRIDDSDNLIVTLKGDSNGGIREWSVATFSTSGPKWVRQIEKAQYNSAESFPLMLDIVGTDLHYFAYTNGDLIYDSQTVSCPLGSEGGYCYVWLTIDTNGVRTSSMSKEFPSVLFTSFAIRQNNAYLGGYTSNIYANDDDFSNFTGVPSDHGVSTSFATVLYQNGTWGYTENWDFTYAGNSAFYHSNGSATYSVLDYTSGITIDGNYIRDYSSTQFEWITFTIDAHGTFLWHASIGFDDLDYIYDYSSSHGYAVISVGGNQPFYYDYDSGVSPSNEDGDYQVMLWLSLASGSWLDAENITAGDIGIVPLISSPEGGILTTYPSNSQVGLEYYMTDNDGDNVGTNDNCPDVYNPLQGDYDTDGEGDACDEDDDEDGIIDAADSCSLGVLDWESNSLTDHDSDGCKDIDEEDPDDDNDGYSDQFDSCPVGVIGVGSDFDGDGCKDSEDYDDDGDGINDASDLCPQGEIDWQSGTVTDHDADGCQDAVEDSDDDNDGVSDIMDSCPVGATDWPSNLNTDFDGDGCRDSFEDDDDDGDGVLNPYDSCSRSTGTVDENGCSVAQNVEGGNSSSNSEVIVYYVCQSGVAVVTDLADCPDSQENGTGETSGNTTITEYYFICPGGTSVVSDMADCPDDLPSTSPNENITIVIDPASNLSEDYVICPGGTVIALDAKDCPSENTYSDSMQSGESGISSSSIILYLAGGAFLLAMAAVLLVLLRRPVVQADGYLNFDSTSELFKNTPPAIIDNSPPQTMSGDIRDGYEWIEWPTLSGQNWYRPEGVGGAWNRFQG